MNLYITRGEGFLKNCLFDGLAHSYNVTERCYVKPYPEVTGYIIKYFCSQNQITESVISAADYLLGIQDPDYGGFPSFYQTEYLYAFDTAQILTGLAALHEKTRQEKYLNAAVHAGRFLVDMQADEGGIVPIFDRQAKEKLLDARTYRIWNGPLSGLMCKVTEAYAALYRITKDFQWSRLVQLTADYYEKAAYIECSHPLGYWLEGLIAAERFHKVQTIMEEKVIPRVQENGYIPYTHTSGYAYVSGTIQLGISFANWAMWIWRVKFGITGDWFKRTAIAADCFSMPERTEAWITQSIQKSIHGAQSTFVSLSVCLPKRLDDLTIRGSLK